jgi:plastocyanin
MGGRGLCPDNANDHEEPMQPLYRFAAPVVAPLLLGLALTGCGGSGAGGEHSGAPEHAAPAAGGTPAAGTSPAQAGAPHQVVIDNFTYSPATLTVPAGATVVWVNRDDVPHTVTSSTKPRLFASQALDTDDRFEQTFTEAGTYDYFCAVHPHMTARITVK